VSTRAERRLPRLTYSVAEAAAVIGISERELRYLIAAGTFGVAPLGIPCRRRLFPRAEIHAYARGEHPSQQHRQSA
jgi:excisionase family DNA binding protein